MKLKVWAVAVLFLLTAMMGVASARWNTSVVLEFDKMDFGKSPNLLYGNLNVQDEEMPVSVSLEALLDDSSNFHFYKAFVPYRFEFKNTNLSLGPMLYAGFDGEKAGGKVTFAFDLIGINWSAFGYFLQPFDSEENIFAEVSAKVSKKLPWAENLSGFFQVNFMDFGDKSVQYRPGFCLENWCTNLNIMDFVDGDDKETMIGGFATYIF